MGLCKNRAASLTFYLCAGLVGLIIILTTIITPFTFKLFPSLMKRFIFTPHDWRQKDMWTNWFWSDSAADDIPDNVDYKHPEKAGFVGGRNFYLNTSDGATLGVWHLLPKKLEDDARNLNRTRPESMREIYNDWLQDDTVFLYLHGSAGSRTSEHRTSIYKLLNNLNYHVVTFDYRGYGDSTSYPEGETDLIVDTETVYAWIREKIASGNIFLWGHSLGSGVAAHFADEVQNNKRGFIAGIILESGFNNMASAVKSSSLLDVMSYLPWFDYCFTEPLAKSDLVFESGKHLQNISTPTLILHAADDKIVPCKYAEELYDDAKGRADPSTVQIIIYNSSLHYGHYKIGLDPELNETVRDFVLKNERQNPLSSKYCEGSSPEYIAV